MIHEKGSRSCEVLAYAGTFFQFLGHIGTQGQCCLSFNGLHPESIYYLGLLITRVYAICEGSRKIMIPLTLSFISGIALFIFREKVSSPALRIANSLLLRNHSLSRLHLCCLCVSKD